MLRRGAARLLPRLLAVAPEASLALQQGETALLTRLAAGAAPANAAATLRGFRSSAAACSSSLADALRWVGLPVGHGKQGLPPAAAACRCRLPPPAREHPLCALLCRNELTYEKQNYEQPEVGSALAASAAPC